MYYILSHLSSILSNARPMVQPQLTNDSASGVLLVKFRASSIIWRSTSLSTLSKIILREE